MVLKVIISIFNHSDIELHNIKDFLKSNNYNILICIAIKYLATIFNYNYIKSYSIKKINKSIVQ